MSLSKASKYRQRAHHIKSIYDKVRNQPYREAILNHMGRICHLCDGEYQEHDRDIQIHHIDGDKTNNIIDNFLPVCNRCHTKIHTPTSFIHRTWTNELLDRDDILKLQYEAYYDRSYSELKDANMMIYTNELIAHSDIDTLHHRELGRFYMVNERADINNDTPAFI